MIRYFEFRWGLEFFGCLMSVLCMLCCLQEGEYDTDEDYESEGEESEEDAKKNK